MENENNFTKDIQPLNFCISTESPLENLFREYERVVFRAIITSFGLDLFIKDQYGGDVDTIHNVRQIGSDPEMQYKNQHNAESYNNRGTYSNADYHSDPRYREVVREAKKEFNEKGTLIEDTYVEGNNLFPVNNKTIPRNRQGQLDHTISAEDIHNDPGRVLAGKDGKELASDKDNLRFTNAALNRNMSSMSVEEYIKWCEDNPDKVNYNGNPGEPLPESVKAKLRKEYAEAKEKYDEKISKAYYFDLSNPNCRQFYKDSAAAAGKRGLEMGLRQAFGFLLTDLWFSVKEEIKKSDGTANGCINAIIRGFENGLTNAKENYGQLFAKFGEGLVSGVFASLTSTLCNIFFTTGKNFGRIIRQSWSSIVEATSILFFNSQQEYFCDRMTSAAKVLATGASVVIGTTVQEAVTVKLAETPIPSFLKGVIATFAGTLSTGMLSVTLLFYIDNDPFNGFIENVYGQNIKVLEAQCQLFRNYCAQMQGIDTDRLQYEADCIKSLISSLSAAEDSSQIKSALSNARNALGLHSMWEGSTLDQKMNDKTWVLTF